MATAGCSTLPVSGPTGTAVLRGADGSGGQLPFSVVEVETAEALPAAPELPISTLATPIVGPTDLVGPGDQLNVAVYEAGVTLFGGGARTLATGQAGALGLDPSASAEQIQVRVDDNGYISLPYVGRLSVAGQTARDVAVMVRSGLSGLSQDPQVLVSIERSLTGSVIMSGEVAKPGRLTLDTNRETLSDIIALAGGYRGEARDMIARVERGDQAFQVRLGDLLTYPGLNVPVAPGDRITVINSPQAFSVLGAANRSEEIRFPRTRLTLAQAVALSGGTNPSAGDAAAIFVFRYVRREDGSEIPVVYHVNMMKPGAYFLSQRFAMRDGDVLYVGNARANQPAKFIQLLSQLFAPIITVQNAARNLTTNQP
ncbi:polysaccharide biosynthesis/export family protein [Sphingomonas sp. LY29]|uniref:polysaccharide biosynthesis/export family protein n=1 Tax=Sphingomonas sp. LY29 TaxID=3095341 RepID=UPI002D77E1E4|nr:polysaccharide biosynthesis/export family protein [Sphingomonas sp. LY29]WRP25308.1 polysaccharide biosynthesis/export family protein [Sphingomonas sp. LY29]